MVYNPNIGASLILDKNLLDTVLEDELPVLAQNVTVTTAESYTPASGSNAFASLSGMNLTTDMSTEDVVYLSARIDLSGDDTADTWEVSFTATAGVGSGGGTKWKVSEISTSGDVITLSVEALWYVLADSNVTYSLQWRRISGGDSTVYSDQRDMTMLKFKYKNLSFSIL